MHLLRAGLGAAVAALLVVLLAAAPAAATSIKSATLEQTLDASAAIVVGRVLGQHPYRLADGTVMTAVTVQVEESLAGPYQAGRRLVVSAFGGEDRGGRWLAVGEATYHRGERVLLQLEVIDGRLHTLGLSLGKWTVHEGEDGSRFLTRDLSGLSFVGGAQMSEGPLSLESFRRAVERGRRLHADVD